MINRKIETIQTKKIFKKFILIVAKHFFLDCLFIFALTAFIALFFCYKYNIIIQKAEIEPLKKPFLLEQFDYQRVIKFWQENEERFEKVDFNEYRDLFKETILPPASSASFLLIYFPLKQKQARVM